jgi:predicted nucleic acid-binding protein
MRLPGTQRQNARQAGMVGLWSASRRSRGFAPGLADIVIGATAHSRQLIILTRTIRHFAPLASDDKSIPESALMIACTIG